MFFLSKIKVAFRICDLEFLRHTYLYSYDDDDVRFYILKTVLFIVSSGFGIKFCH